MLIFFFFNDTATTEIYTLSLHDALPIFAGQKIGKSDHQADGGADHENTEGTAQGRGRNPGVTGEKRVEDRKSTRLNSSHLVISYAVFCLKKKRNKNSHIKT